MSEQEINESANANFLAVDLGASGGRVMWGRWNGQGFELQELHRFPNIPLNILGHLHWNIEALWAEIKKGIAIYPTRTKEPLTSIGVDTWAVDYAFVNEKGQLLGLPYHYRDHRSDGMMEQVVSRIPKSWVYDKTGLQFLPFNTLYQLYSQTRAKDPQLQEATGFLMIPDIFNYRLCGVQSGEYTNATTTQFFSAREKRWATGLLADLDIPIGFLPPVVQPGTTLGKLLPELAKELGLDKQKDEVHLVAPGTHDTASAVAGIPYLDEHSAFLSSGTWSLLGAELDEPIINKAALELNFTNEGGVGNTIRFLKNVMGLWLVQECQRVWNEEGHNFSWEELVGLSEAAAPFKSLIDPDAADFLNPGNMPEAIRRYCQRTGQVVPGEPGALIRCCLESLALKYRVVLDQLEKLLGRRLEVIRVVGGGSRNELLCQFTAQACEREVVAGPVEATALGNIMVQAIATGYLDDVRAARDAMASTVTLKHYLPTGDSKGWDEPLQRIKMALHPNQNTKSG